MNESQTCPECGKPLPEGTAHGLCPACLMGQAMASRTLDTLAGGEPQAAPPSPEEIADRFPQFEVVECLGRGGMGVVYKARQKSLDRWVAIKVLAPERVHEERFAEHFEREAKTLAKMSHPNIVTVFDHGETGGLFYIVMEYVDGVNLRDLLREGKMDPEQALAIVPPVCEALEYAHGKGVVHRDIKPENVLLDRDGRVKIADFGIASLVGATGEKSGTPPYMAPEQERGNVDRRADIYALGVVLYEMLTGEHPKGDVIEPSKKVEVDVKIDEMVLRALEKEPERRYQTAEEFRTMVETIRPAEATAAAETAARPRGMFRRFWWVLLVMLPLGPVLGLGAGLGWAYLAPKKFQARAVAQVVPLSPGQSGQNLVPVAMKLLVASDTLEQVATNLDLAQRWMKEERELVPLLRGLVMTEHVLGTDLMEIRVRSANGAEAAEIANELVRILPSAMRTRGGNVTIHEMATEPRAPVSPNSRLVIIVATLAGVLAAPFLALLLMAFLHWVFPEPGRVRAQAASGPRSRFVQIVEATFNTTFTSPWARKILNFSALGFVGALGFLGFLPFPEAERFLVLSGFAGFFGLIGVAFAVEVGARRQRADSAPVCAGPRPEHRMSGTTKVLGCLGVLLVTGLIGVLVLFAWYWTSYAPPEPAREELPSAAEPSDPEVERRKQLAGLWKPDLGQGPARQFDVDFRIREDGTWFADVGIFTSKYYSGGTWELDGETLRVHLEYSTSDDKEAGEVEEFHIVELTDDALVLRQTLEGGEVKVNSYERGAVEEGKEKTEQVIVEDLAMLMLVAIREKNDAKLQSLAVDRIEGWSEALPTFATELRERYRQLMGNEDFDLRVEKSLVVGEWAVVRCTGPEALQGKCVVLSFVKTKKGWKNGLLRSSTADVSLGKHLGEFMRQLATAEKKEEAGQASDSGESTAEAPPGIVEQPARDPGGGSRKALQFRWVALEGDSETPAELLPGPGESSMRVVREVLLDGGDIEHAEIVEGNGGARSILVHFTEAGSEALAESTAEHIGRPLAIVWKGRVISSPRVLSSLDGGSATISGQFTAAEEAELLAVLNKSGSEDLALQLVEAVEEIKAAEDYLNLVRRVAELKGSGLGPQHPNRVQADAALDEFRRNHPEIPTDLLEKISVLHVDELKLEIEGLRKGGLGPNHPAVKAKEEQLEALERGE